MSSIPTKTYSLPTDKGTFKLYISRHGENHFVASILHWKLTKERLLKVPSDLGSMNFELESRVTTSEQTALNDILNWARQAFGNIGDPKPIED